MAARPWADPGLARSSGLPKEGSSEYLHAGMMDEDSHCEPPAIFNDLYNDALDRAQRLQRRQVEKETREAWETEQHQQEHLRRMRAQQRRYMQRPHSSVAIPDGPDAHLAREANLLERREQWRQRQAAWQQRKEELKDMAECTFTPFTHRDAHEREEFEARAQWIEEERRALEEQPPGKCWKGATKRLAAQARARAREQRRKDAEKATQERIAREQAAQDRAREKAAARRKAPLSPSARGQRSASPGAQARPREQPAQRGLQQGAVAVAAPSPRGPPGQRPVAAAGIPVSMARQIPISMVPGPASPRLAGQASLTPQVPQLAGSFTGLPPPPPPPQPPIQRMSSYAPPTQSRGATVGYAAPSEPVTVAGAAPPEPPAPGVQRMSSYAPLPQSPRGATVSYPAPVQRMSSYEPLPQSPRGATVNYPALPEPVTGATVSYPAPVQRMSSYAPLPQSPRGASVSYAPMPQCSHAPTPQGSHVPPPQVPQAASFVSTAGQALAGPAQWPPAAWAPLSPRGADVRPPEPARPPGGGVTKATACVPATAVAMTPRAAITPRTLTAAPTPLAERASAFTPRTLAAVPMPLGDRTNAFTPLKGEAKGLQHMNGASPLVHQASFG